MASSAEMTEKEKPKRIPRKMLWSFLGRKNDRKEITEERLGKAGAILFVVCKVEKLDHVSNNRCHIGKTGPTRWTHNGWRRQKVAERSTGRRAGALQSHGIYAKFLLLLNDHSVSVIPYLQDVTQSQSLLLLFDGSFGTFYVQEDAPFSHSLKMEGRNKDCQA